MIVRTNYVNGSTQHESKYSPHVINQFYLEKNINKHFAPTALIVGSNDLILLPHTS